MLIAQLTDLHVTSPGGRSLGGWDAIARAEAAAGWLASLSPAPDLVLSTGDNVQKGGADEYAEFIRVFGDLGLRFRVLPGNHDARDAMREVLGPPGWVAMDGPFAQSVDVIEELAIIGLDSLKEGSVGGELCDARLDWLERRLDEHAGRSVMVALHHPPFDSGMRGLDESYLIGRERLAAMMARHGGVQAVVCGHLHRAISHRWAGTNGFVAPSGGRQFAPSFLYGDEPAWSDDPAAAALHLWRAAPEGGGALVSHVVTIPPGIPPTAETVDH